MKRLNLWFTIGALFCVVFSSCLKEEALTLDFNPFGITPIVIDKIVASPDPIYPDVAVVAIQFRIDYTEIPTKEQANLKDILIQSPFTRDTLLPVTTTVFKSTHRLGVKKTYNFFLRDKDTRTYNRTVATFTVSL